jgi:hypothetical protein
LDRSEGWPKDQRAPFAPGAMTSSVKRTEARHFFETKFRKPKQNYEGLKFEKLFESPSKVDINMIWRTNSALSEARLVSKGAGKLAQVAMRKNATTRHMFLGVQIS